MMTSLPIPATARTYRTDASYTEHTESDNGTGAYVTSPLFVLTVDTRTVLPFTPLFGRTNGTYVLRLKLYCNALVFLITKTVN